MEKFFILRYFKTAFPRRVILLRNNAAKDLGSNQTPAKAVGKWSARIYGFHRSGSGSQAWIHLVGRM